MSAPAAVWIAGGVQHRAAGLARTDNTRLYGEARLVRWVPGRPPEVVLRHAGPGAVFKGLERDGDRWLLALPDALLWADDTGRVVERADHPWLCDVHHAIRHEGEVLAACTGLDGVLAPKTGQWWGPPVADRDWRGVDTRPHALHPNRLFRWGGRLWVNRFHRATATEVGGEDRLDLGSDHLHDAVHHGGRLWFTRVDGHLVGGPGDAPELRPLPGERPLGWCRGLARHDDGWVVGFTRLRATRWRRNLAWVRGQLRGRVDVPDQPTRLVWWRDDGRTASIVLERTTLDAVFALCPGP